MLLLTSNVNIVKNIQVNNIAFISFRMLSSTKQKESRFNSYYYFYQKFENIPHNSKEL